MNFPQFWAKADCRNVSCWRWSDNSLAEAQGLARAAAEKLAELFKSGIPPKGRYGYNSDRPLREPVLREWRGADGGRSAVITRNAYGCLVLNTARIMFVDVDAPEPKSPGLGGIFGGLFGKKKPAPMTNPLEEEILAKAEKMAQSSPEWGWRIYRTRAGFRLLATHKAIEPETANMEPVFEEFGADPLYRQLCKTQKCYRARLTPKPWRCSIRQPPRWPFQDIKMEERFKKWEARYLAECEKWATCELVSVVGSQEIDEAIKPIVAVHDEVTRAESKLPLA